MQRLPTGRWQQRRAPGFARCIVDVLNKPSPGWTVAPLDPSPKGTDVVGFQFVLDPSQGGPKSFTLTIIHIGVGFAAIYWGAEGPQSDPRLVALVESRLRAAL